MTNKSLDTFKNTATFPSLEVFFSQNIYAKMSLCQRSFCLCLTARLIPFTDISQDRSFDSEGSVQLTDTHTTDSGYAVWDSRSREEKSQVFQENPMDRQSGDMMKVTEIWKSLAPGEKKVLCSCLLISGGRKSGTIPVLWWVCFKMHVTEELLGSVCP